MPIARRELARRGTVTDWKLRTRFITVARGVVVPIGDTPHDPAAFDGFGFDAVTRARAFHLNHPDAVIGGWAAAAIHGLRPDWSDYAPVLLLKGDHRRGALISSSAAVHPLRPVIRPLPENTVVNCPDPKFKNLAVVLPQDAAAHCLWTILTGRHEWWVHTVPGMAPAQVRAVQFVDAFAQCTWVARAQILSSAKGLIASDRLKPLFALADDGAQSPMETVMRLLVRDLLPEGLHWQSQLRIDLGARAGHGCARITILDLGNEELHVAMYYDGGHHDTAAQTEVDFTQFHALRDLGWEVLRFTRKHLRSPGELQKRVASAIDRARRRLG